MGLGEFLRASVGVEEFLDEARSGPECFKCHEPIIGLDNVRIITVRVEGKPMNVWAHAEHAKPGRGE